MLEIAIVAVELGSLRVAVVKLAIIIKKCIYAEVLERQEGILYIEGALTQPV